MEWVSKGVGKEEAGTEAPPPQILSSCYYVYKQLPQMDVQNVLLQKNKRGKKIVSRL